MDYVCLHFLNWNAIHAFVNDNSRFYTTKLKKQAKKAPSYFFARLFSLTM